MDDPFNITSIWSLKVACTRTFRGVIYWVEFSLVCPSVFDVPSSPLFPRRNPIDQRLRIFSRLDEALIVGFSTRVCSKFILNPMESFQSSEVRLLLVFGVNVLLHSAIRLFVDDS